MKMTWKFLLPVLAALALTACASSAPNYSKLPASAASPVSLASLPSAPVSANRSSNDAIAAQDLLEIDVFKVPDLSKEVRVDDAGNISLALIGTVHAAGMSASELEQTIASTLEKDYMHNPQVNVFVKESTSNKITVSGSVNKPGVYQLAGDTTVTQAIAMAEGLNRLAIKDNITVFRNGRPFTVQLEAINKGLQADPIVMAGDKIQVHTSDTKETMDNLRGFVAPFSIF
jgi:polysaccharide export outer membrane protein